MAFGFRIHGSFYYFNLTASLVCSTRRWFLPFWGSEQLLCAIPPPPAVLKEGKLHIASSRPTLAVWKHRKVLSGSFPLSFNGVRPPALSDEPAQLELRTEHNTVKRSAPWSFCKHAPLSLLSQLHCRPIMVRFCYKLASVSKTLG